MDTRGLAASTGTPDNSPCSPSASAWSEWSWWTSQTYGTPWTRLLSEHSRSTWRRERGSSWSWTSHRLPPCLYMSTRSTAARWCGGTSAGRSASAYAARWTRYHLGKTDKQIERWESFPLFLSDREMSRTKRDLVFISVIVWFITALQTSTHQTCMSGRCGYIM